MFCDAKAFTSFSIKNLEAAKAFYADVLGLSVKETLEGLSLEVAGPDGNILSILHGKG